MEGTIPKIIFTYWEGDQLSQLHSYTILSLVKLNPGIEIIIYTSKIPSTTLVQWKSGEHSIPIKKTISLQEICSLSPSIRLVPIDFEKEYTINNDISVVYKADFVRIAKLYEHGGLWFDFDVLFVRPLPAFLFETVRDMYVFTYSETIPTGFLLSTPKNKYITQLYTTAKKDIHNTRGYYQSIGPNLWKYVLLHLPQPIDTITTLANEIAYPYMCNDFHEFFNSTNDKVTANTICIHWYNGSSVAKDFINSMNIDTIDPGMNVCNKYLHMIKNM